MRRGLFYLRPRLNSKFYLFLKIQNYLQGLGYYRRYMVNLTKWGNKLLKLSYPYYRDLHIT